MHPLPCDLLLVGLTCLLLVLLIKTVSSVKYPPAPLRFQCGIKIMIKFWVKVRVKDGVMLWTVKVIF